MSDLNVKLTASVDPSGCSANAWGTLVHTITTDEAAAFGFGDWGRIQAACGAAIGENPDEWFLHSPTTPHPNPGDHRYDDAYNVFGWQPVTMTLQSTKAEYLGIDAEPVIAYHVQWDNEADHPVHYSAGLAVNKSETVSRTQTQGGSFTSTSTIGVSVGIEGFGDISGEQSFSFESNWSDSTTHSQTIEVGVNAGADSDVPPHSTETAYLFSTLGSAHFRVTYQASLSGTIMAINNDWYGGHGYRGLDPSWVLWKAGLPWVTTIQHDYAVGFYSGTEVDVAPGPFDPHHQPGQSRFRQATPILRQAPVSRPDHSLTV
ncbi:ETX/MTX2 family pore-forming toxin [Actinokineospora inagensis]|uniref:ETX/MTX2 family pore-forming toxin n=1 Tax=Actinokineospora inagensis TaxID=103730 RepID=UPI0003FE161F|nr:ETX/MTX2 family pore-forming toxin [Actinokineospora inagensis]